MWSCLAALFSPYRHVYCRLTAKIEALRLLPQRMSSRWVADHKETIGMGINEDVRNVWGQMAQYQHIYIYTQTHITHPQKTFDIPREIFSFAGSQPHPSWGCYATDAGGVFQRLRDAGCVGFAAQHSQSSHLDKQETTMICEHQTVHQRLSSASTR